MKTQAGKSFLLVLFAFFFGGSAMAMGGRQGKPKSLVKIAAQVSASRLGKIVHSRIYFGDILKRSEQYLGTLPAEVSEAIREEFYNQNYPEFLHLLFKKPIKQITSQLRYTAEVSVNKQGTLLVTGFYNGDIDVRSIINRYEIQEPHQQIKTAVWGISNISFNSTGTLLIAGSRSRLFIWSVSGTTVNPDPILNIPLNEDDVFYLQDAMLAVIRANDNRIEIFDIRQKIADPEYQPQRLTMPQGIEEIRSAYFNSQETMLITESSMPDPNNPNNGLHVIHAWPIVNNVVQGTPTELLRGGDYMETSFNNKGTLFVAASHHPTSINIWNTNNLLQPPKQIHVPLFKATVAVKGLKGMEVDESFEFNAEDTLLVYSVGSKKYDRWIAWRVEEDRVQPVVLFDERFEVPSSNISISGLQSNLRIITKFGKGFDIFAMPTLDFTIQQMIFIMTLNRLWKLPLIDVRRSRLGGKEYIKRAVQSLRNSEVLNSFSDPLQKVFISLLDQVGERYKERPLRKGLALLTEPERTRPGIVQRRYK